MDYNLHWNWLVFCFVFCFAVFFPQYIKQKWFLGMPWDLWLGGYCLSLCKSTCYICAGTKFAAGAKHGWIAVNYGTATLYVTSIYAKLVFPIHAQGEIAQLRAGSPLDVYNGYVPHRQCCITHVLVSFHRRVGWYCHRDDNCRVMGM